MSSEQKRKLSSRFTDEMNRALVEGYDKNQTILKSKFSNTITSNTKKDAWEEITVRVNAVNTGDRKTVDQVKKKWEDLTALVKKKERQARNNEIKRLKTTGNGNLPDDEESSQFLKCKDHTPSTSTMTSPERKVAEVLGPQAFLGISGGIDTFDLEPLQWKIREDGTPVHAEISSQEGNSSAILVEEQAGYMSLKREESDALREIEVIGEPNKRRRKKTLADAQMEYFEVATKYYQLKMEKVKLERDILLDKQKEE